MPPNLNYKRCYVDWGGRCAYCNIGLPRIKWDGKVRAGIDHFIPLSKGGQNIRGNRVLSCTPAISPRTTPTRAKQINGRILNADLPRSPPPRSSVTGGSKRSCPNW